MEALIDITVTADSAAWLQQYAEQLVDERLIACANIVPAITSVYRWEGKVSTDTEALAILHTREGRRADLLERIVRDHPYDEPQVVVLPVLDASPGYHRWVLDSTRPPTATTPVDEKVDDP